MVSGAYQFKMKATKVRLKSHSDQSMTIKWMDEEEVEEEERRKRKDGRERERRKKQGEE